MTDRYLTTLWSKYTISPKSLSGMESLCETCSALTKQPCDIILADCGVKLCHGLNEDLLEVVPVIHHLVRLASEYHGLEITPSNWRMDLQIATSTTQCKLQATECQVTISWILSTSSWMP
jgi:hypothetical protein